MARMTEDIRRDLSYMTYAPVLFISALTFVESDAVLPVAVLFVSDWDVEVDGWFFTRNCLLM